MFAYQDIKVKENVNKVNLLNIQGILDPEFF